MSIVSSTEKAAPKVAFVTLGCAKNEVDTDRMRAHIEHTNFELVDETSEADVVIVNTCSFLTVATEEGIQTTLEILEEKNSLNRDVSVILAGCIPSRYKKGELDEALPEVKAFVPTDEEDQIVSYLEKVTGFSAHEKSASVLRTVEAPFAYVKISDGCDRYCTFCAIPYIRGRYASRKPNEILAEVDALLEGGVKEIVLIGQDTGVWGHDLADKPGLSWLLERVAERVRPYDGWVRVLYLQPEGLSDELLRVINETPEILPYFDIPIQHCDGEILKSMARAGNVEEHRAMIRRLREKVPDIILRTTVIAGFPGETDEQADTLADFLEEAEFDYCGVFMYSQEEGTRAGKMANQVDEDVKLERAQRIQDIADSIGFARTAAHIGEVCEVLVDSYEMQEDGTYEPCGRAWFQAPDTDGTVHLPGVECALGDRIKVRFTDSFCYELIGEPVEE